MRSIAEVIVDYKQYLVERAAERGITVDWDARQTPKEDMPINGSTCHCKGMGWVMGADDKAKECPDCGLVAKRRMAALKAKCDPLCTLRTEWSLAKSFDQFYTNKQWDAYNATRIQMAQAAKDIVAGQGMPFLTISGQGGCGKSSIGSIIDAECHKAGIPSVFTDQDDLFAAYKKQENWEDVSETLEKAEVLIVDEVIKNNDSNLVDCFKAVIKSRYTHRKRTVLLSNYRIDQIDEIIGSRCRCVRTGVYIEAFGKGMVDLRTKK